MFQSPASSFTARAGALPVDAIQSDRLHFDRFVLSPGERLLTRDEIPVEIGGRSFDLLLALVEQAGRMVSKRELLQRVWPGVVVEDAALRFHMTKLRKILGDGQDGARLITTQVGVGYAFVGTVRRSDAVAVPPPAPNPRVDVTLPSRLDRLIGREHDLQTLAERIKGGRLVTIVGPAGVGKTSLAIETAHALAADFADGVDFIDFAATDNPDLDALLQTVGERRRLLVLDNCEHLVQAIAQLVERIAVVAPDVRILATSRQALRARNEHVHRLAPHAVPADLAADRETLLACSAVALFLHQARAAGGVLNEDLETTRMVARICGRLDGLALPIELAATRAATHGLNATARMLGDRLSLLWSGRRTASPRQRTLRATLDWSYALLSDTERRVFERLSRLPNAFPLETALDALADDTLDVFDAAAALDELAEKSLISADDGLYRLPEMTRAYARERLNARTPIEAAGVIRLEAPRRRLG